MAIELVDGRTDTASEARIVSEVLRWLVFEPEAIEHQRARTPSRRDWLGVLDGQPVGVGAAGVPVGMEASGVAVSMLLVLPEARHRGVGRLLYRQVSEHARELGRSELLTFSFEDDPDTVGFAARHGFTVAARTRGLRLPLADCPRPEVPPPAGVAITTLAERPELAPGIWEVACETFPDIPHGGDTPMQAGSYEQFHAGALSGPRYIPDATFAAIAGDEVVGYAQLEWMSRTAGIAGGVGVGRRTGCCSVVRIGHEFSLLGPLEVRSNGRALDLGGQKQRALLALLLLEANRVVSSDRLIDALWEEEPTAVGGGDEMRVERESEGGR